jgi:hypothetical protein
MRREPSAAGGILPRRDRAVGHDSCLVLLAGRRFGGWTSQETHIPPRAASQAAPWDVTPVLSCWPAVALEAGQVRRHIPPRAASQAVPWDVTPVLSCWPAVALEAGQVRRHIPPRAASQAVPWDMTPVLSRRSPDRLSLRGCGQVGRHVPPRAGSSAKTRQSSPFGRRRAFALGLRENGG